MTDTIIAIALVAAILIAFAVYRFVAQRNSFRPFDYAVDYGPKPLMDPTSWDIGPEYDGTNYSLNMPAHPGPGFVIELPTPAHQPHYVTTNYGPLTGKTRITIKGRIEGGPIFAKDGTSPAILALYFQRQHDDWQAGDYTSVYRWYGNKTMLTPLVAGPFEVSLGLDEEWTAVRGGPGSSSLDNAEQFKAAIDNAGAVGFVLGGGDGLGHGIMAAAPSSLIVDSFTVE
jgi:hypothetical protein